MKNFRIEFEDNHLIIVNKRAGLLTQGDKTDDLTLLDEVKQYIKVKENKPGNVYLGLIHRLDRPTSGLVVLAKTSKALTRMNAMFQNRDVDKTYLAVVEKAPKTDSGTLEHYLLRNPQQNKSYASIEEKRNSKKAKLKYTTFKALDRFTVLEIELFTGRHHQIRSQLSAIGSIIKGDLKYGAKRPNRDKSICLHSYKIAFIHPVSKEQIRVKGQPFSDTESIWKHV